MPEALSVVLRSDEGPGCEAVSGRDVLLVEDEVRASCTLEDADVTAPTLEDFHEVVIIVVGVVNGLVPLSLELCKLNGAGKLAMIVAVPVADIDSVLRCDWLDDGICDATKECDPCFVCVGSTVVVAAFKS